MGEEKEEEGPPTIAEKTEGMERHPGYVPFYWDEKEGKLWLELSRFDEELLYVNSLTAGIGSNDIGLDRNQLGSTAVVKFQRLGPKVLMTQVNYKYRALSDNPYEVRSVEEAFAQSVHWGFKVEAEEGGRVLVDATGFLMRDAKNVAARLKEKEQGEYELDEAASAVYMPRSRNFPSNTELEAILTFKGKEPGDWVKSVAPDPRFVTVKQHHSFLELPDAGYKPRRYDPRASFFGVRYMDFAAPVDQAVEKRYICRHRLQKKNPKAETSEPVEPIVYYVDRGIPEPVRSAVVEGASWWNQAFEAAGYRNAFRVELLPEDADPMDARYNVINWVHRSTRGWSYGNTVTDPRTGEIIKGHVSLCSLRIRQSFLIAQGLVADYDEDHPDSSRMMEMALARIRQLSVHEVGHTLGLDHNYCSHVNGRASVMDYPAPLVKVHDGELDLSDAYETGVGEWDKISVAYGYQDFPVGVDEERELEGGLRAAFERGLFFAPSQDAGPGSAHPRAASWVNGADPVKELRHVMEVRRVALQNFTERRIRRGEPMALLEEALVPVYLFHRYQLEAAASLIGGLYYNYTVRGDVQANPEIVAGDEQRRALEAMLDAMRPDQLAMDEKLLSIIPPRPQGYNQTSDLFPGHTGYPFDPFAAAETAANITIGLLLHPERAARLMEYHARLPDAPGLDEVLEAIIDATWKERHRGSYHAEIQRTVNNVVLYHMMRLAMDDTLPVGVRAVVNMKLLELGDYLRATGERIQNAEQRAHYMYGAAQITLLEENPGQVKLTKPLEPPMGPPI